MLSREHIQHVHVPHALCIPYTYTYIYLLLSFTWPAMHIKHNVLYAIISTGQKNWWKFLTVQLLYWMYMYRVCIQNNPIRNLVHVTCILHAYFMWWHALTLAHVICRFHLYLHACSTHVSCNMHGFGTFSMHATCMLHDMHVTCIKQLRIKTGDWEVKNGFPHLCTHTYTDLGGMMSAYV